MFAFLVQNEHEYHEHEITNEDEAFEQLMPEQRRANTEYNRRRPVRSTAEKRPQRLSMDFRNKTYLKSCIGLVSSQKLLF